MGGGGGGGALVGRSLAGEAHGEVGRQIAGVHLLHFCLKNCSVHAGEERGQIDVCLRPMYKIIIQEKQSSKC